MDEKEKENHIEWEINRKRENQNKPLFYFIILTALVILLLFSIWQKNILFGIFIILATGTILFISEQDGEMDKFRIDDDYIQIGKDTKYSYDELKSFDFYEFSNKDIVLLITPNSKLNPVLRVRVYARDMEKIGDILYKKLPRKKTEPSMLDNIQRIIGL